MSGLWGKSGKMAIMRIRKDIRLLEKSGDMSIMRVRKDVRLLGKWLQRGYVKMLCYAGKGYSESN